MGFKRPLVRLQSLGPPGRAWSQFALQALFYPKCNARVQRASFLSTLPTPSRTLYRSRRLFFLKIHRLTRTVAPPFRKRSRLLRLLACKRAPGAYAALPTISGLFYGNLWESSLLTLTAGEPPRLGDAPHTSGVHFGEVYIYCATVKRPG